MVLHSVHGSANFFMAPVLCVYFCTLLSMTGLPLSPRLTFPCVLPLLASFSSCTFIFLSTLLLFFSSFRTKKTVTARDLTGFYAFFSTRKSGKFFHIFGGFLTKSHSRPGKNRKKIHWRKFKKKSSQEQQQQQQQNQQQLKQHNKISPRCPKFLRQNSLSLHCFVIFGNKFLAMSCVDPPLWVGTEVGLDHHGCFSPGMSA